MPRSPLAPHHKVSDDQLTAGPAQSGPATSATGHLPGGAQVEVKTMRRSELLPKELDSKSPYPTVKIRNCLGEERYKADFDGTNFGVALDANPALRHLEEHPAVEKIETSLLTLKKQKTALEKMHSQETSTTNATALLLELSNIESRIAEEQTTLDATRDLVQRRKSLGLDLRFGQLLPANSRYREPINGLPEPTQSNNVGQGRLLRDKLLLKTVSNLLATAGLSCKPDAWRSFEKDNLTEAWSNAHYYVHEWTPAAYIEDRDSPEGIAQSDQEIREEWKNGVFDNERGMTFINFNQNRDWVVWPEHDRTTGYNLSQSCHVHATPSAMFRNLEKNDPAKLSGLDAVFVAPPSVSNALSYLKAIPQGEAHHALASYCSHIGSSVADLDFEEFGRFMQRHFPEAVVARYDAHLLDENALGATLDESKNNFLLVNLTGEAPFILQEKKVCCFQRPGVKLSPNNERMGTASESGVSAPRSEKPRFEQEGHTPQGFLQSRRDQLFRAPVDAKTVRSTCAGGGSKLYNPSDYSGNPHQFEMPSAVLRQYVANGGQIGIVSLGDLRTSFSPEAATLEHMAKSEQITRLKDWFAFAGVTVESPAELARFVYKTHGVWTEMSVESMKRYVEHQNGSLPDNKKIKATLDVIRHGRDLPNVGDEPKGCLIQFLCRGKPATVAFYRRGEHTLFQGLDGKEYLSSHLNAVARYEGWHREGPVSILRFEGESVLPLVDFANQEDVQQDEGTDDRKKRKRRNISTSSALSDMAMRPKPRKTERLDSDASDK